MTTNEIPLSASFEILRESNAHDLFTANHNILIGVSLFHLIRLNDLVFNPLHAIAVVRHDLKHWLVRHENISCGQLDLIILSLLVGLLDLNLLRLLSLHLLAVLHLIIDLQRDSFNFILNTLAN